MKLGKNARNRLRIFLKSEILVQENFQKKRKSAEKRNSHTPDSHQKSCKKVKETNLILLKCEIHKLNGAESTDSHKNLCKNLNGFTEP